MLHYPAAAPGTRYQKWTDIWQTRTGYPVHPEQ